MLVTAGEMTVTCPGGCENRFEFPQPLCAPSALSCEGGANLGSDGLQVLIQDEVASVQPNELRA